MTVGNAFLAQMHDQVLVVLRAAWGFVGDEQAPAVTDPLRPYAIVEYPPGGGSVGGLSRPDGWFETPLRLRMVAVDPDVGVMGAGSARQAVEGLAALLRGVLLDHTVSLDGASWRVTGRAFMSSSGVIREGTTLNLVDDYLLTIT